MAIFTHVWVSWYEIKVFRGLTGCQRDTSGFGASQLAIRAKVNNYLGSSVGVFISMVLIPAL